MSSVWIGFYFYSRLTFTLWGNIDVICCLKLKDVFLKCNIPFFFKPSFYFGTKLSKSPSFYTLLLLWPQEGTIETNYRTFNIFFLFWLFPLRVTAVPHLPLYCLIFSILFCHPSSLHDFLHEPFLWCSFSLHASLVQCIHDPSAHHSLVSLTLCPNHSTWAVPVIYSFLILSIQVTPKDNPDVDSGEQLSLFPSSLFLSDSVSKPYIIKATVQKCCSTPRLHFLGK